MKKFTFYFILTALLCGYSAEDDADMPTDELLAGTEWRYGIFEDDDVLDRYLLLK